MRGVGEVDDLDPHGGEAALQLETLGRAPPVVTLEEDVERALLPGDELVGLGLDEDLVDERDVRHDLGAFGRRHDRAPAADELERLVVDHARDQVVAVGARMPKDVEMADVEQVPRSGRIANRRHSIPFPRREV